MGQRETAAKQRAFHALHNLKQSWQACARKSGARVRYVVGAFIAAVVVAGSAIAADEPKFDRAPDWLKKPDPQDLMAVWPEEAMQNGKGGKVSAEGPAGDADAVQVQLRVLQPGRRQGRNLIV